MLPVDNRGSTDFDALSPGELAEFGAIILCGGQSARMGRDKATLPFGPGETMLQRVVRLVGEAVPLQRIVCAAALGQRLPQISAEVRTVFDHRTGCGPLAGLARGLTALRTHAEEVYVTGCDTPLLVPRFVRRMFELLGDFEIVAPHEDGRFHPFAAVYRTDVLPVVEAQLASDDRSLVALLNTCHTRRVPVDELRDVDPNLASLAGCNTPEDYQRVLQRSHLPPPMNQEMESDHG